MNESLLFGVRVRRVFVVLRLLHGGCNHEEQPGTVQQNNLIQQLENTNKSLEIVTAQNKKQDDRLTALEKAPGTFGNKLWWAVIAALVSGLVAYELTMLLH